MAEPTSKTTKKSVTTEKTAVKSPAKKAAAKTATATAKKPAAAKAVSKTTTKATAPKKPAAPKKAATGKNPAVKRTTPGMLEIDSPKVMIVSDEQRYRMVAEAAYYRAESNHFRSDPIRDWVEAEKDIAALLSGGTR